MTGRKIKRAFVTGADGFIGSHLVEHLVQSGVAVKALVQYNSFESRGWLDDVDPKIRAQVEIVSGDIRDFYFMKNVIAGCDTVLHLAALIGIPYSYVAVQSYIDVNVTGTANVLQASRDCGVEKFIQTSTSEVYGSAQFVPMTEEHPLNAQSPYAASKIGADQMALAFARSFNIPVTILRPFNNFGPRQSTRAIIPTLITQFISGAETIRVGSLDPTRDFVFVKDTARAFLAAAQTSNCTGEVINVGNNFEISVANIIDALATITGRKVKVESEQKRVRPAASEVTRLWADNAKAKRLLNWEPHYSGLPGFQRGLAECMAWYREHGAKFGKTDYGV
jgi:dTDP-glucose 4,6-dehydratase